MQQTKEQRIGREMMQNLNNTQYFRVEKEPEMQVKDVLAVVYQALTEKGYNPVNQIVGYIMSGDPTYITSHNNARSLIMKVERDEIVEEVLKEYIRHHRTGGGDYPEEIPRQAAADIGKNRKSCLFLWCGKNRFGIPEKHERHRGGTVRKNKRI